MVEWKELTTATSKTAYMVLFVDGRSDIEIWYPHTGWVGVYAEDNWIVVQDVPEGYKLLARCESLGAAKTAALMFI